MTTGSIPRHLLLFALPILAGSLLQTAYSFIDAIWVGRFLGTAALAAITVSFPIVFALIALGAGLTLATNVLIAQYFGAHRHGELRKVVDSSLVLIGLLSLVLLLTGELLAPRALRAMETPPEVLPLAVGYIRVYLLALPFSYGLFLTRSMMQGVGDSRRPLYFQTASVLLNTALDPLLIFGLLGFPRLGLNGAAWSNVIAQGITLAALLFYLEWKPTLVTPNWRCPNLDSDAVWTLVRIGLPSAAQQVFVSLGAVFVISIVNRFGPAAVAAYGAGSRIDQIAFMPALTYGLAISTVAGQNLGAGAFHRVRLAFRWGVVQSGSLTLMGSVLAVATPQTLLRIFTTDPEVITLGVLYLRIVGGLYVFLAVMFIANGITNGAGHTLVTTGITVMSLWVVRVPLALFLSRELGSVVGVWYAIGFSFVIGMLLALGYYLSGRWQHPIVRRSLPNTAPLLLDDEAGDS
jgi:putative MATE family efflux protein